MNKDFSPFPEFEDQKFADSNQLLSSTLQEEADLGGEDPFASEKENIIEKIPEEQSGKPVDYSNKNYK